MPSIVDTSVKVFKSDMLGAPVLNGTSGSMIALLDACLVTGFGAKAAASLVVAGGVATLTFAGGHGATQDSVISVDGATGPLSVLNGSQRVAQVSSTTLTFATDISDGTATGAVTFKMASAGWSKPFAATNVAVFKSIEPTGTGMLLRVDDASTTSCRVVGYEAMTDVNTGIGAFPTATQIPGGGYWAKSSLASAQAVPWVLVADGFNFYLHVSPAFSSSALNIAGVTRGFGDVVSYRPGGDPYTCALSYSTTPTINAQFDGALDTTFTAQLAMPRGFTALGSASLHGAAPFTGGNALSGSDPFFGPFPSAVDGGLRLSKKWIGKAPSGEPPRGELAGLYHVPMSLAFNTFKTGNIIPGTGGLAGRKLIALNPSTAYSAAPTPSTTGVSFIDITGPWR